MAHHDSQSKDGIFSPILLPCGRRVQNRLVKVALYEHLASLHGGPPNKLHCGLYSQWSKHDWGMVITGNVQVSPSHLTLGRDIILPEYISTDSLTPFKELLYSIRGQPVKNDTLAIMQLSHAGRQTMNFIGGRYPFQRPLGPSPIKVKPKNAGRVSDFLHDLVFQTPHAMSATEIEDVIEAFVRGAKVALESGFDGVEIHAAHGYLIAQFISPQSNKRTDEYSSDPENALRLLHRIVTGVRLAAPKEFVLGIKMNAADYADPSNNLKDTQSDRVLNHVRTIASWGMVDFIEVSGGDYEKPDFVSSQPLSKSQRQVIFAEFSKRALNALECLPHNPPQKLPLILLTGGLRTPELLLTALQSKHAHLLGIGRGAVLCPNLPTLLREMDLAQGAMNLPFRQYLDFGTSSSWLGRWLRSLLPSVPVLGAGVEVAWYNVVMRRLARSALSGTSDPQPDYQMGRLSTLFWMWVWLDDPATRRRIVLVTLMIGISLGLFAYR